VNCNVRLVLALRAAYMLLPFLRRPILGHDIVLRKPLTWRAKATAPLKKFLLSRVDHYSLHFRDLGGYTRYFGIRPEQASYVAFKASIRNRDQFTVNSEGDYVLCMGWSERDYDTFFRAMEGLPYPGAIPQPNFEQLGRHSSRFTRPLNQLPPTIALIEDDLSSASMVRIMERARLVVLPTVASRINASGIGIYLNAMIMGKCVIISEGPGSSDVLTGGEALLTPPEDSVALADRIRCAWENDELRERTAQAGLRYAESCGGEPELRQRVLDIAIRVLGPRSMS
jgi:glycosyltransferase involved in cell wall biosynthesis